MKLVLQKRGDTAKVGKMWDKFDNLDASDAAFRFTDEIFCMAKVLAAKPKRVVDVGCGGGRLAKFVRMTAKQNIPWVAIDSRSVEHLWKGSADTFIEHDLINGDLPPYVQDEDCIVMAELLEHLPEKASMKLLRNSVSRLRIGGRIVITCPGPSDYDPAVDVKKWGHLWAPKPADIESNSPGCSVKVWMGRFFGDATRLPKIRKILTEKFGEGGGDVVDAIADRYSPLVASTILCHACDLPTSHINAVVTRLS
jgi:SAM-dependent methyltransferase